MKWSQTVGHIWNKIRLYMCVRAQHILYVSHSVQCVYDLWHWNHVWRKNAIHVHNSNKTVCYLKPMSKFSITLYSQDERSTNHPLDYTRLPTPFMHLISSITGKILLHSRVEIKFLNLLRLSNLNLLPDCSFRLFKSIKCSAFLETHCSISVAYVFFYEFWIR